jgi:hypothetical protein
MSTLPLTHKQVYRSANLDESTCKSTKYISVTKIANEKGKFTVFRLTTNHSTASSPITCVVRKIA